MPTAERISVLISFEEAVHVCEVGGGLTVMTGKGELLRFWLGRSLPGQARDEVSVKFYLLFKVFTGHLKSFPSWGAPFGHKSMIESRYHQLLERMDKLSGSALSEQALVVME